MTIRTFIIEDQEDEYNSLSIMLRHYYKDSIEIVSEYLGSQPFDEALDAVRGASPDLLFVDYDLQEGSKNGLLLCEKAVTDNMFVVFFSREEEAKDSSLKIIHSRNISKNLDFEFDWNIVNIPKNNTSIITKEELDGHIKIAKLFFEKRDNLKILLNKLSDGSKNLKPISKIIAIEADGKYSKCYLQDDPDSMIVSQSLSDIEVQYPSDIYSLYRCHRHWLINSLKVLSLTGRKGGNLKLKIDGIKNEIPIGESFEKRDSIQRILDIFSRY